MHTEYGLDENSGGGLQDEDSEESDGGEAGGLAAHVGAEAVAVFEEEEGEGDEKEEEVGVVDYYWDTAPGLAMARNFNLHCLPQILEQIASCGALGPILSATERRQATHTKAQDRGSRSSSGRSSGKVGTASDDAVAAEPDDAVGDTAYVTKYPLRGILVKRFKFPTVSDRIEPFQCSTGRSDQGDHPV